MSASPDVRPLWIARLEGDQETMGRQHGALAIAAGGAEQLLEYYPELPERLIVGDSPAPGLRALRLALTAAKEAALLRLDRDRPADLRARTRAFMVAAGRPARYARFVGVMDLFQNVVGLASRIGAGPFGAHARALELAAAAPACSTAMAWGAATVDGEIRHARNFDFPGIGFWDTAPALVLCKPDRGLRYGFVTTRGADTPCVTVFNEAGLTVTTHTRFHREVRIDGAAIVDIVHEIGRRAETLADAARIAAERPSASTWGLAVSSAREKRGIVLELHGGMARVVEPATGASSMVCANRYRHPDMQKGEAAQSAAWALHTDARERRLRGLIQRRAAPLDAAALLVMLADREDEGAPGVRRHLGGVLGQGCNVHTVVAEPASQSIVLGIGPAPVCDGPFVRVRYDWDGPVGAWELGDEDFDLAGLAVEPVEVPVVRTEAARHVAAAIREEQSSHDPRAIAAALERAIAAAPQDPSLRLAAAWTHLRRGDAARALGHVRAGLVRETLPYRRGQLLLWGARAALAAREADTAATMWSELDRLSGLDADERQELRAKAQADQRAPRRWRSRRPDAHLSMLDAH